MNKRRLQIIAVTLVAVVIIGSGVWLSVAGSSRYALYKMYHAAQTNNTSEFTKYYQVYVPKTSYNEVQPPALETFKKQYYKPLSFWDAMFRVSNMSEKITPNGGILIIDSQKPKVAFQMIKRNGNWIALSVAVLEQ